MKTTRIVSLVLILCIALTMFSACGSKTPIEEFAKAIGKEKLEGVESRRITKEKSSGQQGKPGYSYEKTVIYAPHYSNGRDALELTWDYDDYGELECNCSVGWHSANTVLTRDGQVIWQYMDDSTYDRGVYGSLFYSWSGCEVDDDTQRMDFNYSYYAITDLDAVLEACKSTDVDRISNLLKALEGKMTISAKDNQNNSTKIEDWEANSEEILIMLEYVVEGMEFMISTAASHGYDITVDGPQ